MKTETLVLILLILFTTWAFVLNYTICRLDLDLDNMHEDMAEIDDRIKMLENQLAVLTQELEQRNHESDVHEADAQVETSVSYEKEIEYLAKTVWGEARGLDKTQQAAVVWCILNRVDSDLDYMPNDIISVITQKNAKTGVKQFDGYDPSYPATDDIRDLVVDVLDRWLLEKETGENVGRVLPSNYLYFRGHGTHNAFRVDYKSIDTWDWRWGSPYV